MIIRVENCGRPTSLNDHRTQNRYVRARDDKAWREAAHWAVKLAKLQHVRFPGRVEITATPLLRRVDQDPGNAYPSVKAAIDGIVDSGILVGDARHQVAWIKLMPPRRSTIDGLEILIEAEEQGEPDDPIDPEDERGSDPAGARLRSIATHPCRSGAGVPPGKRRQRR